MVNIESINTEMSWIRDDGKINYAKKWYNLWKYLTKNNIENA